MLDQCSPAVEFGDSTFILTGNPCESGGSMIDGDDHDAVDTIDLATSKGYVLNFTDTP